MYRFAVLGSRDIYSRKIVGYSVRDKEISDYAALLVDEACQREGGRRNTLVLHQDNGSPMKGATLKATLDKLGVCHGSPENQPVRVTSKPAI